MDPVPIAVRLPQILRNEADKFLVVICGKLTPAQEAYAMKRHVCRVEMVKRLLEFYTEHNVLYQEAGVSIDEVSLEHMRREGADAVMVERVEDPDINVEDYSCSVRNVEVETSGRAQDSSLQDMTLEYKELSSIMVNSSPQTTVEALQSARDAVLVRNYGNFISDYDGNLFGLAYPELFPYGRGHPGTRRKVVVSVEECCRHYMRLSRR